MGTETTGETTGEPLLLQLSVPHDRFLKRSLLNSAMPLLAMLCGL